MMSIQSVRDRLSRVKKQKIDDKALATEAVELAADLLDSARNEQRISERRQAAQMARMMVDPAGKAFTLAMADQVFRPPTHSRSAAQFRHLVEGYGVPHYLSMPERVAMKAGATFSAVAPDIVMPAVTSAMRSQSASVILPAEDDKLKPLLARRKQAGMRMNLNQLGEAILGEGEAAHRIEAVIARLKSPDCDYLSVKISAIFSQIHLVGEQETLARITERLRELYRVAIQNPINGKPKFVNLDMEEYRDLHLTCDAFRTVLDEPEFMKLEAGIVLQAYLPDSWPVQKDLIAWAKDRVARGGAGIKIRIVKGANLAMESVEAELHDWPLAPYDTKEEVDANFKRMVHEACKPETAKYVRHGVASHNLFDIAYTLLLRAREGTEDKVEFEMLEGMANHQARAVHEVAGGLLLYAPVVSREDFHSAIAYLVRRLDENTSEENFLHDLFDIAPGNAAWKRQEERFLRACARKDTVLAGPKRHQDRATEHTVALPVDVPFHNADDTDYSLPQNRQWIRKTIDAARGVAIADIPLVIAGKEEAGASQTIGRDPSRPGVDAYRHALAGPEQVERALQAAVSARTSWQALGYEGRAELLRKVAAEVANARGEATATMMLDGGKAVTESDGEISEAIDFANYYARGFSAAGFDDGAEFEPFGTVLVTPPWNFPFAIPLGSVLAALIGGNTVIFKPAPETVLTGWVMINCLWRAGIPKDVLQFVPCPDNEIGRSLVTDDRIGAVILTGAYETARMFLDWKPSLRLFAETSGKNSLVVTAAADPDQAVKDLVKSAFGHAGQKCSAASLGIIEAEVYDNPGFRKQLKDAASSLRVAGSWNLDSIVTPVIREPGAELERALTSLEPGEEWLLEPKMVDGNPCLWSPGIKLGVDPQGWYRRTECFGPVLGLIRANDVKHAIRIQNDSNFALTGGISSLDDREIDLWREKVEVGNAYINRPITGAIVQRQPFGGWKRSCFGPGSKAGGPNYCQLFGTWTNAGLPQQTAKPGPSAAALLERLVAALPDHATELTAAAGSDALWNAREFSKEHDPSGLRFESNVFRYRKFQRALIRIGKNTSDPELARLLLVAAAMNVPVSISTEIPRTWLGGLGFEIIVESEAALAARLPSISDQFGVLRAPNATASLKSAAIAAGLRWADGNVLYNARLEWPAWLREQAVSETRHRYGNLLPKPSEL
ncbi:proline dehydrogenase family protein [Luteolibacter ambystomatis]|uniref:L-glutamate gamma-semialdehyde dehydrogenase n=1 Tax=Luteolibacter ambystomatis TaxID=2824561 RepID=A0A975PGQ5_9BACT|nr:bifunctional proline dehydrogenase/L-glutamate gamma-semialdehyde dehydrogenase [Luteolibacter ambystomatis]QUE52496.1 proline dehydrogenase family protein [Luteolibacter ambystomatis]